MRRSFLLLVATIEGRAFVDGCSDSMCCTETFGCASCKPDNPEEGPSQDVPLRLVRGDRAWNLGVADAGSADDNQSGWVTWTFRVPRGASAVMPRAAASSITANSGTHGAPGPASVRPGVAAVLHHRRRLDDRDLVGGAVLDHVPQHPHLGRVPLDPVGAHRIEESDLRVTLELEHGCCCHDTY